MKMIKFFWLVVFTFCFACDSDMSNRLDDMAGIWQLTEMTYTDTQGDVKTIDSSPTRLTFTKEIAGGGPSKVDGVRYGNLDTGEEVFSFQYSIDFSQGKINILFDDPEVRSQDLLPLDAVGRKQVYDFQVDKTTMVISTETEFNQDRADGEVFTDVRYLLKK